LALPKAIQRYLRIGNGVAYRMCLGNWSRVNREVQARFSERVRGKFPRPTHHGDGLAIWYKQLQRGTFRFPDLKNYSSAGLEIDHSTLRLILDGIDLSTIRRQYRLRINSPNLPQPQNTESISGAHDPLEGNSVAARQ